MVAFNWSHEPGPTTTASTMPHSHPAVEINQDVAKLLAGAEGAGSVGRAEVRILVSAQQLRGNEGGAPHPITQGRGGHCVLL